MYKNNEGYADPTAGAAISRIMKEHNKEMFKIRNRENNIKSRPKVYIVSKYAGDVKRNVSAAIRYCRYAIGKGKMPIASHLLYPQILDDNIPTEREIGTMFGLSLLKMCDEVWCSGTNVSPGMKRELEEAKALRKPIKYFNAEVS